MAVSIRIRFFKFCSLHSQRARGLNPHAYTPGPPHYILAVRAMSDTNLRHRHRSYHGYAPHPRRHRPRPALVDISPGPATVAPPSERSANDVAWRQYPPQSADRLSPLRPWTHTREPPVYTPKYLLGLPTTIGLSRVLRVFTGCDWRNDS